MSRTPSWLKSPSTQDFLRVRPPGGFVFASRPASLRGCGCRSPAVRQASLERRRDRHGPARARPSRWVAHARGGQQRDFEVLEPRIARVVISVDIEQTQNGEMPHECRVVSIRRGHLHQRPLPRAVASSPCLPMFCVAARVTSHGEPLQREGRPGAVPQEVLQWLTIDTQLQTKERDPHTRVD